MNSGRSTKPHEPTRRVLVHFRVISWIVTTVTRMRTLFSIFLLTISVSTATAQTASPWPKVPPADFTKLKPSDFADDELDLPYYLAHFHRLANSVVEEGENRGF